MHSFEVSRQGEHVLVSPSRGADHIEPDHLRQAVEQAVREGTISVVVDLSRRPVTTRYPSGILHGAHRRLELRGGKLAVYSPMGWAVPEVGHIFGLVRPHLIRTWKALETYLAAPPQLDFQNRAAAGVLAAALPGRYAAVGEEDGVFRDLRSGTLLRAEVPGIRTRFRLLIEGRLLLGAHRLLLGCDTVLESEGDLVALSPLLHTESVESRAAWLTEGEPGVRLARLITVAVQIAEALSHAHERHVVHPDLDLAAIRFLETGDVAIQGFGVADGGEGWLTDAPDGNPSSARDWNRYADLLRELFALAGEAVPAGIEAELELLAEQAVREVQPRGEAPETRWLAYLRRLAEPATIGRRVAPCDWSADEYARIGCGLLALGFKDRARQHFTAALQRDPIHPEALYHMGVEAWRSGVASDDQLRIDLENAAQSEDVARRADLLLGHLHLQRADAESAVARLTAAGMESCLRSEVEPMLARARSGLCISSGLLQDLDGHSASVSNLAFLPDGRRALSAGEDGVLKVWDLEERRCVHDLRDHAKSINCLTVSADGTLALTGSADPRYTVSAKVLPGGRLQILEARDDQAPNDQLRLWDLNGGRCARILQGPSGAITAVALSPDGAHALSGSKDGAVWIWDRERNWQGRIHSTREKKISFLGFLPDGEHFACVDGRGELVVLPLQGERALFRRKVHSFEPKRCLLSADGDELLFATYSGRVEVLDLQSGASKRVIGTGFEGLETFAMSTDGSRLLVGGQGTRIALVDGKTGRTLRTFEGHRYGIRGAAMHPKGRCALTGGLAGDLKLWAFDGAGEGRGSVVPVTSSDPGSTVEEEQEINRAEEAAERGARAERMDQVEAALLRVRRYPGRVRHPRLTGYVRALSRGGKRTGIRSLWIHARRRLSQPVLRAVSPNGTLAVTAPIGTSVGRLEGLGEDSWFSRLSAHPGDLNDACFTLDGRRLLTASRDYSIAVWDVLASSDGEPAAGFRPEIMLHGHMHRVSLVRVSMDGRRAISAAYHEGIRYWDLDRGTEVCRLDGPMEFTQSLAIAPDGRWAASGHHGGEIRIWDLVSGRQARVLRGHVRQPEDLAITGDGHRLISVGSDGTLKVWDMALCRCVLNTKVVAARLDSLALTPDGRYALVGSLGAARLLDLIDGQVVRELRFGGQISPRVHADNHGGFYLGLGQNMLTLGLDCRYEYPEQPPTTEQLAPFCWSYLSACSPPAGNPSASPMFDPWYERLLRAGLGGIDRSYLEQVLGRLAAEEESAPPLPAGIRPGEQIPFDVERLLELLEQLREVEPPEEWARRFDKGLEEFEPLEARRYALRARLQAIGEFLREHRELLEDLDLLVAHPEQRIVGVRRALLEELCRARFDRACRRSRASESHDVALFQVGEVCTAVGASPDSPWCTLWLGAC